MQLVVMLFYLTGSLCFLVGTALEYLEPFENELRREPMLSFLFKFTSVKFLMAKVYVAAYLIAPQSDASMPPPSPEAWEALREFDVDNQLCERKDVNCSWAAEMNWARHSYNEAKDLPLLDDLRMFPSKEVIKQTVDFVKDYDINVPYFVLRPWERLLDAYTAYPYLINRRRYLGYLKQEIGPEAYYQGILPQFATYFKYTEDLNKARFGAMSKAR